MGLAEEGALLESRPELKWSIPSPDDQIQFSPPEDSSNSDTLHLLGSLPGRISVWVRRSKFNTALTVYLVCQTAYSHWTFIRDMYRMVRPTIAQIPVVATQVSHWLRCYETLNPASAETGRRLIFSPGWHAARDEDQLRQNLGALGWKLTPEQIAKLDKASNRALPYPHWHANPYRDRVPLPV